MNRRPADLSAALRELGQPGADRPTQAWLAGLPDEPAALDARLSSPGPGSAEPAACHIRLWTFDICKELP